MLATLEDILGPENAELAAQIRRQDRAFARDILDRITRPLPTQDVADWAVENVRFDEPKFKGPFSLQCRHYLEEPLNLFRRDISNDITDLICCFATRTAKTRIAMAGACYRIALDPMRCLWTKPMKHGAGGSRNDAITKFIPMLKASPGLVRAVEHCDKHSLNGNQQRINGSIIDWEGTGSAKQLSSNPDDVVVQDECDGYVLKGNTEAHPSIQADERTKDASNPLRYKSCSPTVEDGVIWQWLMRSDLRRRFLPCPRCNPEAPIFNAETQRRRGGELCGGSATGGVAGQANAFEAKKDNQNLRPVVDSAARDDTMPESRPAQFPSGSAPLRLCVNFTGYFTLGWSEQYNVLPLKFPDGTPIPVAYVKWDPKAKHRDGTWDLDLVMRTAHFECPHCHGQVYNHEKEWMDERGFWLPTKKGEPGVAGFQLSSLYVTHDETAIGILAKKFLGARASGQTMKGFINNDLAEVDVMQEHGRNKIEIINNSVSQIDWVPQLTADFHKNWPYIWFVVRKWCAFKLLAPFPITNGIPEFFPLLELPENAGPKEKVLKLAGAESLSLVPRPSSLVIAELMRFDSRTGASPLVEFLIAQDITADKLVKLYRETARGNTMDFRKVIFELMAQHAGRPIACPRGGDSELVAAGHCELSGSYVWNELTEIIQQFQIGKGMAIPNRCVAIDCGFAEKFNRVVLQMCYESATVYKQYDPVNSPRETPLFYQQPRHQYCLPAPFDGWLAVRGKPTNRPLGGGKLHPDLHMNIEDPFYGTPRAGTAVTEVLELPQGLFWLRKEDLRQKRAKQTYAVSPEVEWYPRIRNVDGTLRQEEGHTVSNFKITDYERQLNEQWYDEMKGKVEPKHGRGGSQNRAHPYHLDDCETYQIALATHNEFFEETETK